LQSSPAQAKALVGRQPFALRAISQRSFSSPDRTNLEGTADAVRFTGAPLVIDLDLAEPAAAQAVVDQGSGDVRHDALLNIAGAVPQVDCST
jgi:hypothetical protein